MNKTELVAHIAKTADISTARANFVVQAIVEAVTAELSKGGEVALTGFGTFRVGKRAARTGRNLRTGEALEIPACNTVQFKAGSKLKAAVN